jgi:hypothetical protein
MDYYDRKFRNSGSALKICWYCFIGIIITLFLSALFSGCKSIQYVPVETVHTDTLYQKVVQRDSIHIHDSVTIREKGDTVMIEHWRTQWRDRLLRDTIYRSRVDSIQVPYPVEKQLTKWQQVCIDYGKLTMGATVLLVIFLIVWIVRRLRKV